MLVITFKPQFREKPMDKTLLIIQSLNAACPDEVAALGPTAVQKIAAGQRNFQRPSGGSYADFAAIFEMVVRLCEFISTAITVYTFVENRLKRENEINKLKEQYTSISGDA